MSYNEFRDLSSRILDPSEVDAFCRNVFRMFDSNKDANLTFDEFTIATSAKDSSPAEKLAWLFDHVYDKVSYFFVLLCPFFCRLETMICFNTERDNCLRLLIISKRQTWVMGLNGQWNLKVKCMV
jgi:hypothetical protein